MRTLSGFLFGVMLALVLGFLLPSQAEAQTEQGPNWDAIHKRRGDRWVCREWPAGCAWEARKRHYYRPRSYEPRGYYERNEPRVYSYYRRERDEERWERRDPGSERGVRCKDETVRVVGGAHLTKEGAINDAIRQWQSTVRYDHGERFMDAENARGYRWRCDRASTNESTVGKIGEALGRGDGFQKRCVVLARPCMMPVARGDKDDRDDR